MNNTDMMLLQTVCDNGSTDILQVPAPGCGKRHGPDEQRFRMQNSAGQQSVNVGHQQVWHGEYDRMQAEQTAVHDNNEWAWMLTEVSSEYFLVSSSRRCNSRQ